MDFVKIVHFSLKKHKVETNALLSVLTYATTALARLEAGEPHRIRHMRI